jgi:ATPase family associated with various cellular activities (AAA)
MKIKNNDKKSKRNTHLISDSSSSSSSDDELDNVKNSNKNKKNKTTNNNQHKNNKSNKNNNETKLSGTRRQREEDDFNDDDIPPIIPRFNLFTLIKDFENAKSTQNNENLQKKYICTNPECDHLATSKKHIKIMNINYIKSISQLIELGKTYHCKRNKLFNNINLRVLYELIEPLTDLQEMIGLSKIKDQIVDQLLYFLQGYHNNDNKCKNCYDCKNDITCMKNQSDMLHTVITGSPGAGKTEFAKCIGKMYKKLGILTNDKFKIYSRADLIGQYLGHTADKTQKCIDECKGGVMFIDEAYALGNSELRDSFSKECIDTLNQNLSERRDFLCIIAGYKDAVNDCFFKYNEGLNRRFSFRYELDSYTHIELKKIFELKAKKGNFKMYYNTENENDSENMKIQSLFKTNKTYFENSGGDMETLFLKCKIVHSRTILNNSTSKYVLSYHDISKGIELLINSRNKKNTFNNNMYL